MAASPDGTAEEGSALSGPARDAYARAMFDRIAAPYDRLNRVISLGRDGAWRRRVVALSGAGPGASVADLGCGTGDLALAFARAVGPEGRVHAVDLAANMLRIAAAKRECAGAGRLHLHQADAAATGLDGGRFDAVSMGWVLRNVGDRGRVYAEARRLLRPGGCFVVIDMSRPSAVWARAGFWLYRHTFMPLLARCLGGDRAAYRYLARSTDRFPAAPALAAELRLAGFSDVAWHPLALGSIAIHVAHSPGGVHPVTA